ncbi:MAG: hypothetical protein A3G93_16530 [Nitrospinae bacterium RIFCSPLOWO2_12_FULL_45_22]|nr:MAG: hypothetical protein A3G93_16530 [Nitrospinae bacterium RIFCSPLOWO2_12_FULL_45_22]
MKRILVTGGAGFIGSHLVKALVKSNHNVLVVDDLSFGKKEFLPLNGSLKFVQLDITNKILLEEIFLQFKPEIVVHLAAIHFIPYCNAHPVETSKVNIIGTRNILDICRNTIPEMVLYASTAAVYPIRDEANDEESEVNPIDIYGITKLAGEDLCKLFYNETGINTVVMRFFNAYGPNETNAHVIPEIVRQLKSGKRKIELGNLAPKRDYIHVKDKAKAIMALMEKVKNGYQVVNIGSGNEYSVSEILRYCEEILKENIEVVSTKERTRKMERKHLLANINKIKNLTGWSPRVEFKAGLRDLLLRVNGN